MEIQKSDRLKVTEDIPQNVNGIPQVILVGALLHVVDIIPYQDFHGQMETEYVLQVVYTGAMPDFEAPSRQEEIVAGNYDTRPLSRMRRQVDEGYRFSLESTGITHFTKRV
ncbi:MAG TPA: hypothetical protein VLH19_00105 [Patescibacteria group bacterium]|nr:hypothetical protein [Patescibacteria group bacterium]